MCVFLPQCVLKTNCEMEDDPRQVKHLILLDKYKLVVSGQILTFIVVLRTQQYGIY
jgi:hypothetical protein